MARLNAPAVAPESIESLKRRFIRQNRDIARVNSTQSLRIRELENEISKLLSENLSLREQIIRLQCDQEARLFQKIGEQTSKLKSQLESKLLEISSIITEFGQDPTEKKALTIDEDSSVDILKTPGGIWKETYEITEAVANPDERLPPIMENDISQLRTSENQDMLNIMNNTDLFATESPDIGSPPTSQFVDADPVKIDFPLRDEEIHIEEPQITDPMLSTTVEQRKKRKDIVGPADTKPSHSLELRSQWQENSVGIFKNGAKRKLCTRDEEEKQEKVAADAPTNGNEKLFNGLEFAEVNDQETLEMKTVKDESTRKNKDSLNGRASREKNNSQERKVLAPKCVNMSPKKISPLNFTGEAKKPIHDATQKTVIVKERGHKNPTMKVINTRSSVRDSDESTEPTEEIVSHSKLKTTATSDNIQTTSLQSSNMRARSEEATPSSDLDSQADSSRPSRRARGSVSYAEPSLRHKIRRPTQEMADAVARDKNNQAGSNLKSEEEVDNYIESHKVSKNKSDSEDNVNTGSTTIPYHLSSCPMTNRKKHDTLIGMNEDGGEELGIKTRGHTMSLKTNKLEKTRSLSCNLIESDSDENQIWEGLSRRRRRSAMAMRVGAPLSKDIQSLQSVEKSETRVRVSS